MLFDMSSSDADDLTPIPNHVPWYYMSVAIIVLAALTSHGVSMVVRGWALEFKLPKWSNVFGDVLGIVLATAMGCLGGYLVWEWVLGGMVALVGAVSSSLVVSLVRVKIGLAANSIAESVNADKK